MLKKQHTLTLQTFFILSTLGLVGCSQIGQLSRIGSGPDIDNTLIIPPSLQLPAGASTNTMPSAATNTAVNRQTQPRRKVVNRSGGNYYIIVGTYPDQLEALDTFTRISSIGLKGATMETRKTKSGNLLHMVRLGPYTQQQDIDKAKDSLTNTGLSQFKIVKN